MPIKSKSAPSSVRSSNKGILIFLIIALIVGGILGFLRPWKYLPSQFLPQFLVGTPSVSAPSLDATFGKTIRVDPDKETTLSVISPDHVITTVRIPKGAVTERQIISVVPLYHDEKSGPLSSGVYITPETTVFNVPITLSFDFSKAKAKTDAPAKPDPTKPRITGKTQVLSYNRETNILTPTLVQRAAETRTYLPAQAITGGVYIYALDGRYQTYFAKQTLGSPPTNVLAALETVQTLVSHHEKLSSDQLAWAKNAIQTITVKKSPDAASFFAAVVLQKQLETYSSVLPKAYAAEVTEGYLEFMCKLPNLTAHEYLTEAATAQYLGYANVAEGCITAAKNAIAEHARQILSNPNATIEQVLGMMAECQLLGLTELNEALFEKAGEIVTKEAKKVLDNPNATDQDLATALQNLQLFTSNEDIETRLIDRIKNELVQARPPPQPLPQDDLSAGFDISIIWLLMAKALGIGPDSFDAPGIAAWVARWVAWSEEVHGPIIGLCQAARELGQQSGSDVSQLKCEKWDGVLTCLTNEMKKKGAEAVTVVGSVQSQGYQQENFGVVPIALPYRYTPPPQTPLNDCGADSL